MYDLQWDYNFSKTIKMSIIIVKTPIKKSELSKIAVGQFGDFVKIVVDVKQGIIAIGGELHADEEVLLTERENSKRENTWGINFYPEKAEGESVGFDSMINLKPHLGNRSRDVESVEAREKIMEIVKKLIVE